MTSVCILNYGSGNARSVSNLFQMVADQVVLSNDIDAIRNASHIVLPGVGAFGAAMQKMRDQLPLPELEHEVLSRKKPFMGICVGMQVLADYGMEFGEHRGLGWIGGRVELLQAENLRLPHVGWNDIEKTRDSPLLEGLGAAPDFYFVHSYRFAATDPTQVVATCDYGLKFPAIVQRGNIFGVQFHPEKSQSMGLALVRNFLLV